MSVMRTERGLDRLVNFSDATVAIAITLLILPLIDAGPAVAAKGLGPYFQENYWQLLAFAFSFVVIARFWMVHHQVLEWADGYTPALLWLNVVWLASIVFIPFTANVLSESADGRPDVYALYIGNLLLTTVAMQFMELVIVRTPGLLREDAVGATELLRGWAFVILVAAALVLAVALPGPGMLWLLILFLAQPLQVLLGRLFRSGRPSGA
jgi:uncharacterized membrane protein